MHELINNNEQEFIINSKTLNKIIKILEDKPFKIIVDLLNEIKAIPYESKVTNDLEKDTVENKLNN